jgi:hypothetical protein
MFPWFGRSCRELLEAERGRRVLLENRLAATDRRLASHAHTPDTSGTPGNARPSSAIRDILCQSGQALSALTILGFAAYAMVWVSYARFYGQFDIRPEDVGLTYAAILIRAGLGVAPFFVAFLAPILPLHVLFSPKSPGYPKSPWALFVAWWTLCIWAGVEWFLPGDYSTTTRVVVYTGIALPVLFLLLFPYLDNHLARLEQRWNLAGRRRIVAALIAVVLFAAVLYLPNLVGRRMAESVKRGSTDTGGLDLNIVAVRVVWTNTEPRSELPADPAFMYLGQADQALILYETRSGTTYRVSSQSVFLVHEVG